MLGDIPGSPVAKRGALDPGGFALVHERADRAEHIGVSRGTPSRDPPPTIAAIRPPPSPARV